MTNRARKILVANLAMILKIALLRTTAAKTGRSVGTLSRFSAAGARTATLPAAWTAVKPMRGALARARLEAFGQRGGGCVAFE